MWPANYPDKCPPDDARQDEISVYRLVSNTPPTVEDFKATIEEQPHRPFTSDQICMAHGVSVFRDKADALKQRARFNALKNKKVAFGKITKNDGMIKETGQPTHMTWWLQTSAPHASFSEVEDV